METNLQTGAPQLRQPSARIWLVVAYVLFAIYAAGLIGAIFFSDNFIAGRVSLEQLFILMGFITLYGILTTLPMLMVIGYQRSQLAILKSKICEDLWLCGLDSKQLSNKMQAFNERNSWGAFILPAVLTMIFLAVMWSYFLMPGGQSGLIKSLSNGVQQPSITSMMSKIAGSTSVIMMTFLGTYFYILNILIRRWQQSDLTTSALWRINVRLAVALLVGFLLAAVVPGNPNDPQVPLLTIGFLAGIVPDTVLRWLSQQARRILSPKGESTGRLFKPSDLQEKIEGLNFWQVDRLLEEGIESVQDLAMKEIPDLLIETRFDTPHVLYWVDQALLSNQVGEQGHLFHQAFIKKASDLVNLAEMSSHDPDKLLNALNDGQQNRPAGQAADRSENDALVITLPLLENIVEGLRNGPNLPYAREYWRNTSTPQRRAEKLAELDRTISTEPS